MRPRSLFVVLAFALLSSAAFADAQPATVVPYKSIDDTQLKLHVFNPVGHSVNDQRPAIVFFFGGGWNGGSIDQFYPQCEHLASRGMVAICADYRVKKRNNTTPKECVKDGKSALRWVRAHASELGIDPNKLLAGGGSAGGHVAAATALTDEFNEDGEDTSISCRPNALVLFNPVFDNSSAGYGYDRVKEYWQAISPLHNIDQQAPPTLVMLGTRDKLVPVSTAKDYQSRMQAAGARCDLKLYEGEPHGFFNKENEGRKLTTADMDKFLTSLGYLPMTQPVATDAGSAEEHSAGHEVSADDDRDARMQWWHEAKFGMFVHWGIYSVVGGQYNGQELPNSAEWMMNKGRIPIAEYEQYAARFNPTKFDANEFVGRAKAAGMKYLVITAKHHDGFSMFASKATKYNVVDATPFKRDIMKELAVACRDAGIRFGFYYSQAQDWHHPGGFGNNWDKTLKKVSKEEYVREKAAPEVKQLLTEYGSIGIFWWDTPRDMSKEAFDSLHLQTALQPGVITNDRLGKDYPGDHTTFERKIPAKAPASDHWEVCMPISGSWGYKKSDTKFKSTETLIRNLADITSKGGNYLLNVSPTGEGTLLPQATERLKAIGEWMEINSESIYGTTASPFSELSFGRCTKKSYNKGTTFYFHIFDWPEDGKLVIPGLNNKVNLTYMLADMKPLEFQTSGSDVVVSLPSDAPDKINSVLAMHVSGPLDITEQNDMLASDGSLVLKPKAAYMHNNEGAKEVRVVAGEVPNIGYWTDPNAWIEWSVKFEQAGTYNVVGEVALEEAKTRFLVGLPKEHAAVEVNSTGGYANYEKKSLGTIEIEQPGTYPVQIIPEAENWQPMNVRKLELKLQ